MKKVLFILLSLFFIFSASNAYAYDFSYGIKKEENHERPYPGNKIAEAITNNGGYYIGPDNKNIYLTFDCGYENGYTIEILDILKETDTKALFFITGHYLESSLNLVKRMISDGHIVGNHTYTHLDFNKNSKEKVLSDIKRLETRYNELLGYKMSYYLRPPEGKASDTMLSFLNKEGYTSVFWSLAYVDWYKDKFNGNKYSYNNVINRIHNGAIILMHTVSKDNCSDLKDIIIELKKEGYIFETLDNISKM